MKAPEWQIEDFAYATLGAHGNSGSVCVLAAYFDESGTTDADKIALYGGAVARTSEWMTLERPWRDKLKQFGVSTYHASPCEWGKGEFAHLSRPIREALTGYLAGLIGGLNVQSFGSAILRKDWQYVPEALRAECFDDPIVFSIAFCFAHVSAWAQKTVGDEPVAFVFACHKTYGQIIDTVHKAFQSSPHWTNIGSLTFASPERLVQLQAADLLSYEFLQFALDNAKGSNRPAWKKLNSCVASGSGFGTSYKLHNAATVPELKPFASSSAA